MLLVIPLFLILVIYLLDKATLCYRALKSFRKTKIRNFIFQNQDERDVVYDLLKGQEGSFLCIQL